MIKVGQTLLMPSGSQGEHLFFIVVGPVNLENAPKDQFILVNATTIYKESIIDNACIIEAGDHPFITHKSYIRYQFARLETRVHLENNLGTVFKRHQDCSPELLKKIIDGAKKSNRIRKEIQDLFP